MNIQLKLTAIALTLLMAITSLTMAAPSPWQLGRVSRQLCDNLNNITVGEMKNISTLSQFKDKKIQADSAMSQIMQAQQYIQSNYVDSTSRLIAEGNMEPRDRDFALDFQPRLVNTYRKCDLWINGFLFGKPDTISDVDYASMENYCKVEPQNLYKTHCEPPSPPECTEKGTRVGKTAWRKFKRGAGVELCTKLAEVNTLIAELAIDNPLTPCDDAFNDAVDGYIGEQTEQLTDRCAKELEDKAEQARKARLEQEQRDRDADEKARIAEEQRKQLQELQLRGLVPEMVDIPAGSFMMGSPEGTGGSSEHPQHMVTVAAFRMGKYEVTNAQFRAFRSSHDSGSHKGQSLNGDQQPVVNVTWQDAVDYTKWLSQQTGKQYRLPSEAEWEYAARAGTSTARAYYWGDDSAQACNYANVRDETANSQFSWDGGHACTDGYAVAAPVGQFTANAFGLHDMWGNVWEWTQDRWHDSYTGSPADGSPWQEGNSSSRSLRGCSWSDYYPGSCSSASRYYFDNSNYYYGFRVAVVFR